MITNNANPRLCCNIEIGVKFMFTIKNKRIKISVRNLVEFLCRHGDIDNRYSKIASDNEAMLKGTKMHKKIQKSMGANYTSEVLLKINDFLDIDNDRYEVVIEGRADGVIIEDDIDIVDEIKSTYRELKYITEPDEVHLSQAKCYAYMLAVKNDSKKVAVTMTYCNLEDGSIKRFRYDYDVYDLKMWFCGVINELKKWMELKVVSEKIRNESIKTLKFPFEYRKGQKQLVVGVYKSIEARKNIFLQAPTGIGKTMSTIFPSVKAMQDGMCEKIFYLTAKTITRTVAVDAFAILQDSGAKLRSIVITAKEKVCLCENTICNPVECIYAKGHFDRVNEAVFDMISHEYLITRGVIEKYASKYCVCPFEMSLDATYWCDAIVCDYNYVFDPNVCLKRFFADAGNVSEFVYLIDEAHNLVDRAREMYSAKIVKEKLMEVEKFVRNIDNRLAKLLSRCNRELLQLKRECDNYEVIANCASISLLFIRLQSEFERFFEECKELADSDFIKEVFFEIRHFNNMQEHLDENYVIYTGYEDNGNFYIKLFCVNPSTNLSRVLSMGRTGVFFSATLLPVNYYKNLLSTTCDEDYAMYTESPFDKKNRVIAVSRDVTSKYTRRNETEYQKIAMYIDKICGAKKGNYMVFFPSYKYMKDVYLTIQNSINMLNNINNSKILMQSNDMDEQKKEEFLENFVAYSDTSIIGLCVLGGVFSEGIDLANEALIGSIVVGTGIPMVCNEREILRKYYDKKSNQGYEYSYIYPGINKVLQAAGRVIRTSEDKGVIAVLDERLLDETYDMIVPREWDDLYVVNVRNIENLIKDFWNDVL